MNEAEWLACNDPQKMLEFLRGRVTARQLRLFGVACCRHVWHLLLDTRSRQTVELAEATAEDKDTRPALYASLAPARRVAEETFGPFTGLREELERMLTDERAACLLVFFLVWRMEGEALADTSAIIRYTAGRLSAQASQLCHADLIRDIVGNPFRPAPPLPPAVLAWNDRLVPRLAQAIYDERKLPEGTLDPSRLAVLHDALLDAGCHDEELLSHLRSEGHAHWRGCWGVDLLLGKD